MPTPLAADATTSVTGMSSATTPASSEATTSPTSQADTTPATPEPTNEQQGSEVSPIEAENPASTDREEASVLTAELGEQQEREAPESNAGTDLVGAETLSDGAGQASNKSIRGSGRSENASQSRGSDAGSVQTTMPFPPTSEKDPEPVPAQQSLSASERIIAAGAALNSSFQALRTIGQGVHGAGSRAADSTGKRMHGLADKVDAAVQTVKDNYTQHHSEATATPPHLVKAVAAVSMLASGGKGLSRKDTMPLHLAASGRTKHLNKQLPPSPLCIADSHGQANVSAAGVAEASRKNSPPRCLSLTRAVKADRQQHNLTPTWAAKC